MTDAPHFNELGQPVGFAVPGWRPPPRPARTTFAGRWCRLEPADLARHADELHAAYALDGDARHWTYLPALARAFGRWLAAENFDAEGWQRTRFAELTAPLRPAPVWSFA